jgi:hypothetical protein
MAKTRSTKKMAATPKARTAKKALVFSTNKKLNAVLSEIHDYLLHVSDTRAESIRTVKRYRNEFPREIDYNIAQYGNLLIYYDNVRKFYEKAGYTTMKKWSDNKIWETYKRQVGWVVRNSPEFK